MSFDWIIYRELNPDLKAHGLDTPEKLTKHYLNCGIKEKRPFSLYKIYPDFNHNNYRQNYQDLENLTKLQLERHWLEFGIKEKRTYRSKNQNSKPKNSVAVIPKLQEITFIIPTIGRSTLINTIKSVQNQSKDNWRCIIVFDGIDTPSNISNLVKNDKRFNIIRINKAGCLNHGARVRNAGLKLVKGGWVGFVDDDDSLSPYYVEHMNNYLSNNMRLKCIIFRMMYTDNNVIPKINSLTFYEGNVGISFCFSSELLKYGFYFTPSSCEDYVLLNRIRSCMYKIVMSSKIGYLVRPVSTITKEYMNTLKHIESNMSDLLIN